MQPTPPPYQAYNNQIKSLHATYCRLRGVTEKEFPMRQDHFFSWEHFVGSGHNSEELTSVMTNISAGIKKGFRRPEALGFRYLISNLSVFEDEWCKAKAAKRNAKPPPTVKDRYAPPMATDTAKTAEQVMATSEQITELLKAAHAAADRTI